MSIYTVTSFHGTRFEVEIARALRACGWEVSRGDDFLELPGDCGPGKTVRNCLDYSDPRRHAPDLRAKRNGETVLIDCKSSANGCKEERRNVLINEDSAAYLCATADRWAKMDLQDVRLAIVSCGPIVGEMSDICANLGRLYPAQYPPPHARDYHLVPKKFFVPFEQYFA